jgi:hypothetical protein
LGHSTLIRSSIATLLIAALGCVTAGPGGRPGAQEPGPKLLAPAAEVAREYACAARTEPLLVLEQSSIQPSPLAAGEEFAHRFVYALCAARSQQGVAGKLRTRIRFGASVVVDDSAGYRALPGRWAVDTVIALPPQAAPGGYELDLEFTSGQLRFATRVPFSVWVPAGR